ncbi:MAG: O-antigen ligase family protein, partial [Acidobacteria bacterium]|nr:O-antigen ligase family protein [Acidobacteriota bacterium]
MRQVIFLGLMLCAGYAVLAFGGTQPVLFAPAQIGVFLLFAAVLWGRHSLMLLPWKGPALLLAYAGLQSLSIGADSFLVHEHLLRLVAYLCFFFLAVQLGQSRRFRYRVALALIGLGLLETVLGMVQYLGGWQQIFTYKKIFYTEQATGTYINPNHFAGLLEMILPLSLGLALNKLDLGEAPKKAEADGGVAPAFFFFFLSVVFFLGLFFSRSRMGIFSALAAVVMMGILWMSVSLNRLLAALVLATFLVGAGVMGVWVGVEPVVERYAAAENAYLLRSAIWTDTAALIRERPLWGTGLGTFGIVYPQVQTTALNFVVDHAHNDYLEIATELGIPGAILLFGLILVVLGRTVAAFYNAPRHQDRFLLLGCCGSILALLFHSFTDFNLQIPANAAIFAMILGLSYGVSCNNDSPPP